MEIILSPKCKSFTGTISHTHGYSIQQRKNGFFGKRNSQGHVPPDGHWRFIVACAEIAKIGLHIADVKVSREEVKKALYEAHMFIAMQNLGKDIYTADDIINLKITFGL